jgi:hypothetical protein
MIVTCHLRQKHQTVTQVCYKNTYKIYVHNEVACLQDLRLQCRIGESWLGDTRTTTGEVAFCSNNARRRTFLSAGLLLWMQPHVLWNVTLPLSICIKQRIHKFFDNILEVFCHCKYECKEDGFLIINSFIDDYNRLIINKDYIELC